MTIFGVGRLMGKAPKKTKNVFPHAFLMQSVALQSEGVSTPPVFWGKYQPLESHVWFSLYFTSSL